MVEKAEGMIKTRYPFYLELMYLGVQKVYGVVFLTRSSISLIGEKI